MYNEDDPFNPSPFNPSGTMNTAYYERLADEQRRRDEDLSRQRRQREDSDRQQAEWQLRHDDEVARQRRQSEDFNRQQAEWHRTCQQSATAHPWDSGRASHSTSGTSTTGQSCSNGGSPAGFVLLCALFIGLFATVWIPYHLGVVAGLEQSGSRWWLVLRGLGAGLVTAGALTLIGRLLESRYNLVSICSAGVAIAGGLASAAGIAGMRSAPLLVCYIAVVIAALALTGTAVFKLVVDSNKGWQEGTREMWGWVAVTLAIVMVSAFTVGVVAGHPGILPHGASTHAAAICGRVLRLPEEVGNNAATSHGWTAAWQWLLGVLVAAVWSAVGWFYGALVSPARASAVACALTLGIAALGWTTYAAVF